MAALKALKAVASVVGKHHALVTACMVDFISKDVFSLVDPGLAEEVLTMSEQQLRALPLLYLGDTPSDAPPNVAAFARQLSEHTLEGVAISREAFLRRHLGAAGADEDLMKYFDKFMSDKKMHEVVLMSQVVLQMSKRFDVDTLLDLGSGKAYLSQVVTARAESPNLRVLAVDASSTNSTGAELRSKKLEKFWGGLIRRAEYRKDSQTPPPRGKHWKAKRQKADDDKDEGQKAVTTTAATSDRLKFVTQFVDTLTDFEALVEESFSSTEASKVDGDSGNVSSGKDSAKKMGVIGLHTCGNLAPNSLRVFLAKPEIKFICNVGCCYHHLHEEFYRNPYMSQEEISQRQATSCFPLSTYLRQQKFQLGKNALMVAAQPMDRLVANQPLPSDSLLWRAILQVILLKHKPDLKFEEQHVGRVAKKSHNFVTYVHKSFEKLGLELKMSDTEIEQTHREFSLSHRQKLMGYYQLKSMLGPLIEGLILLDRLQFMLEQDVVQEAFLVKMFDAVVSPRCYSVVAIKK